MTVATFRDNSCGGETAAGGQDTFTFHFSNPPVSQISPSNELTIHKHGPVKSFEILYVILHYTNKLDLKTVGSKN